MLSESSEPNTINICSNSKWTVEGYSQWCSLPECFRSGKSGAGWTSQSDWSYCCTRSWHSQRLPWWDCRERKHNQANENSTKEIFLLHLRLPWNSLVFERNVCDSWMSSEQSTELVSKSQHGSWRQGNMLFGDRPQTKTHHHFILTAKITILTKVVTHIIITVSKVQFVLRSNRRSKSKDILL